jgi:hypothetical protein
MFHFFDNHRRRAIIFGRYENQFINPAGALDRVPRYRRVLIGLCAGITALFSGLLGGLFVYGSIVGRQGVRLWLASFAGTALLVVAFFMSLVWLRLWFGPREWIDRAINKVFMKVYVYLMLLVVGVMVVATAVMAK